MREPTLNISTPDTSIIPLTLDPTPEPVRLERSNRRDFLRQLAGVTAAVATGACSPTDTESKTTNKTESQEKVKSMSLDQAHKLLQDYESKMSNPDFKITKAAREALKLIRHQTEIKDGTEQDRNMSITFTHLNNTNPISVTIPILHQDKKDPSKDERVIGKKFIKGSQEYKLYTDHPVHLDIGVANKFTITKTDTNGVVTRHKVLAIKRAPYRKGGGYSKESVIYTPPSLGYITDTNVKAGKEYIKFVTDTAGAILYSILEKSTRGDTNLVKNFKNKIDFVKKMVAKLMIVEHIDPGTHLNALSGDARYAGINLKSLMAQSLTEYALNGSQAFAYLDNSSDAMGSLQIRSDTYSDLLNAAMDYYGIDLKMLQKEPISGRKNPIMAAVFAMILCYDNFMKLKNTLRETNTELLKLLGESPEAYETLLVSNYNASASLVHKCIKITMEKAKYDKKAFKTPSDFMTKYQQNVRALGRKIQIATGEWVSENATYVYTYLHL